MDIKTCTKCGEVKPLSSFNKNKANKDGLAGGCRDCRSEVQRNFYRSKIGVISSIHHNQKHNSKRRGYEQPSYTRDELAEWAFNQPLFHKIYKEWVDGGFVTNMKPSCDRLDDYKSYTFDNIQLLIWRDNHKKYSSDKMNGINTKECKSVQQFGFNGDFINEYYSINKASRETGVNCSHICQCCIGNRRSASGFKWNYAQSSQ